MKFRITAKAIAGGRLHIRVDIGRGVRQRLRRLAGRRENFGGEPEHRQERRGGDDRDPQPLAHDAAHLARTARAMGLRREPGRRHEQPEAAHPGQEEDHQAQRRAGERVGSEPADHGRVGRHHPDPGKLGEDDGGGKPGGLAQLAPPGGACVSHDSRAFSGVRGQGPEAAAAGRMRQRDDSYAVAT
jgi:hypothetical protein